MVSNEGLLCIKCGNKLLGTFLSTHRCPKCNEPLLVMVNFKGISSLHELTTLAQRPNTYLSLGEGNTPLIKGTYSYLKLEYLNPTGSFKDRGAALAVAIARKLGYSLVIEDSSGNAGLSVATYASAHNIKARIYVPTDIHEGKYDMLVSVGAEVIKAGTRNEAHEAAIKDTNGYYVGHVTNPYFIEGMKDIALEIIKQYCGVPKNVVLPVASGTLLLGVWKGFKELLNAGLINSLPRIIAVQAAGYASLIKVVSNVIEVGNINERSKYADALRLTIVPRLEQIGKAIEECNGLLTIVGDDAGINALKELWRSGLLVEPTSAYTYAATRRLVNDNVLKPYETVTILTGSGLKFVSRIRYLLQK